MKINGFQEQFDEDKLFRFFGQARHMFFNQVAINRRLGISDNMPTVRLIQDMCKPKEEADMWCNKNKYGEFVPHIV